MLELGSLVAVILLFGYLLYTRRSVKEAEQETLDVIDKSTETIKALIAIVEQVKKAQEDQQKKNETDPDLH